MSLNLKLLPPGQLPLPPDPTDGGFDFDFDADSSGDDSDNGEDEDYGNGPFLVGARRVAPTTSTSSAVDEADPPDPSRPPLSFVGTSEPLHFQGKRPRAERMIEFTDLLSTLLLAGSFSNATRGMASRSIRGTVRMSAEGAVVWRMVIRYGGSDQWLMSGVQVGGPRSKYGMVGELLRPTSVSRTPTADRSRRAGNWSTADHDDAGPVGPFHYFPHQPASA